MDIREEAESLVHHLLGSQKEYLFAPDKERVIAAGWRAGKTRIGCLDAIIQSVFQPDNYGFIGRAIGKDLQQTTMMTFDEILPSSLIVNDKKHGQFGRILTLRSVDPRRTSTIEFNHIIDRQTGKHHIAGGNWGWFFVDQGEEITHGDWLKLLGRLSRKHIGKRQAFANINQQGHDWWFNEFYAHGDYKFDVLNHPEIYFKCIRGNNRLGIIARSEENRESHGGFVPDDYYDTLRRTYPAMWCARYLDGSFDDFSGKVYADYSQNSVHNLQPFNIPDSWPYTVAIDVGGSAPWSIGVYRSDPDGNVIRTKEFHRGNVNPNVVISWIRDTVPCDRTRFVIDPENRVFTIQLQDELGIIAEPAIKDILPGIAKTASWFFPVPPRKDSQGRAILPDWASTQPEQWRNMASQGMPRLFVVDAYCPQFVKSIDNLVWDEKKQNKVKETEAEHVGDEVRYLVMSNPSPAIRNVQDRFEHLKPDLASYHSARHFERLMKRATISSAGFPVSDLDGNASRYEPEPIYIQEVF